MLFSTVEPKPQSRAIIGRLWRRIVGMASCMLLLSATASATPWLDHPPLDPAAIPPPGTKLKLSVFFGGSRDFERPMRMIVIRDQKLMDIWLPAGRLDLEERPYYQAEVYAPERLLHYRFIWYDADGTAVASPDFFVERQCTFPTTEVTAEEASFGSKGTDEAGETERLFHVSEALNREIVAYQEATKLLEELRTAMDSVKAGTE